MTKNTEQILSRLPKVTIDALPDSDANCFGRGHSDRGTWGMGAKQMDLISGTRVIGLDIKSQTPDYRFEFTYKDWVVDPNLVAGKTYPSTPWAMRNEVLVAISPASEWTRKKFVAFDAYRRISDPGMWAPLMDDGTGSILGPFDPGKHEIIRGGWDHEHCCVCLAHIDDDHNPWGYISVDDGWLCEACHKKYIVERSLDFLEEYAIPGK